MINGLEFQIEFPSLFLILLKITIVLCVGWLLHFCLRRKNPHWRMLVWRGVVCGVVFIPLISAVVPSYQVQVPQTAAFQEWIISDEFTQAAFTTTENTQPLLPSSSNITTQTTNASSLLNNNQTQNIQSINEPYPNRSEWISSLMNRWKLILWSFVAFLLSARLAFASFWLYRIKKASIPAPEPLCRMLDTVAQKMDCSRHIKLRYSAGIATPSLCGLFKPVILLPRHMIEKEYAGELPGIFAHELTHLKSKDMFWITSVMLLQIVLWFHPLVWRMRAVHSDACEEAGDAAAAAYIGSTQNYSKTLARVALDLASAPPVYGGITMATTSNIRKRLDMLKRKISVTPVTKRTFIFIAIIACLCLTIVACFHPQTVTNDNESNDAVLDKDSASASTNDLSNAMTIRKLPQGYTTESDIVQTKDGKYAVETDWDTGNLVVREIESGEKRNLTNKGTWDDSSDFAQEVLITQNEEKVVFTWYNTKTQKYKYELHSINFDGSNEVILFDEESYDYVGNLQWIADGERFFANVYTETETKVVLISLEDESFEILQSFARTSSSWPDAHLSPDGLNISLVKRICG